MKIFIENSDKLSEGIWLAPLSREHALKFGTPKHSKNGCSVVLLSASCVAANNSISIDPDAATLLNLGTVASSIFIEASSATQSSLKPARLNHHDKVGYLSVKEQCQKHLPRDLAERVANMLGELSEDSSDDLVADKTNRWISRPDNYFTVKVQPQNKDVVVTIRGRPSEYSSKIIELQPDQNGYSKFWISQINEIQEATRLIRAAHARGRLR